MAHGRGRLVAASALAAAALLAVGASQAVAPPSDWPPFLFKIPQQPSISAVWDVEVAPDGMVWAADHGANQVFNFDPRNPGRELRIGSGGAGSGDGELSQPAVLAVDTLGNVYVGEQGNHRIQKFTRDGAFVTKWGSLGSGDGQFVYPVGIAVDAEGFVYVTDLGNDRVQKFTGDGVFVKKWGSHGSGDGQFDFEKLCSPRIGCGVLMAGLAFDPHGDLYVADTRNARVQKFSPDGTFLAKWPVGSGGLAIDSAGNIFVSNWHGGRVQKATADGKFVTSWGDCCGAGDGAGSPEGIGVDRAGNVYAAHGGRIQKFTSDGKFLAKYTTFGAPVRFRIPNGVAVDAAGNLYVADTGTPAASGGTSARVAKFTSSGAYLGQLGSPGLSDGLFTAPAFVAIGPAGDLYVLDRLARRIQKLAPDGAFVAKWPVSACASGFAVDGGGDVYVTDNCDDRISRYSGAGELLEEWKPHVPPPPPPQPPAHFPDPAGDAVGVFGGSRDVPDLLGVTYEVQGGEVVISETFDRAVALNDFAVPPQPGATVVRGVVEFDLDRSSLTGFCFGCIFGAQYRVGAEKHLFFDVVQNGLIHLEPGLTATAAAEGTTLRFRVPGAWLDGGACLSFGTLVAAGFEPVDFAPNEPISFPILGGCFESGGQPSGVAVDAEGVVYVAMSRGDMIQTFTRGGEFLGEWSAPELGSPGALAFDRSGNLLVADSANRRIERFTPDGAFLGQFDGEASSLAVDPAGSIYAADPANDRVRKYGPDGALLAELTESPAPLGRFNTPQEVAVDGVGNIYVLDSGNARIQKFASGGAFLTQWKVAGTGIGIDGSGVVYVVDPDAARVQRFASDGSLLGAWGSPGFDDGQLFRPNGIALDAAGSVYVTDLGSADPREGRIQKFTGDGVFLARIGSGTGVATDGFGNVYGAGFDRIRKYASDGTLLTEWGTPGNGEGQFFGIHGLAVDSLGYVYVSDRNSRVQMFTSRGAFVATWGALGGGDGEFMFGPEGIAVDAEGDVYVVDPGNHRVQAFRPVLHVRLDVKPGNTPNSINPASRGTIPVAILSMAGFDAPESVDRTSLTFGRTGEEASLAFCNRGGEDVNSDGRPDLVCHFATQAAGFLPGDTAGLSKGKTAEGVPIGARDAVQIVP